MKIFEKLFSDTKKYKKRIEKINLIERELEILSDDKVKEKSLELKEKATNEKIDIEEILPMAFALVRESAKRTLKQRHFDVQLMGGIAIFEGKIAEMVTGEGKTLVATAPAYLHGLSGKGVHVVTVNDYLAQRDAVWMGQIYNFLGLKTSCIIHESAYLYDPEWKITSEEEKQVDTERDATGNFKIKKEYLKPISRKEAYQADIVYGTNHEFGFDYLRDNLAYSKENQAQKEHYFAIIDEIDSILIDEARTPLIISSPDVQAAEYYKLFARLVERLEKETDYEVIEKERSVKINESGIEKIETALNIPNIYDSQYIRLVHYLEESLKAKSLFQKDRHYIVKNNEIIIVDEFTGRLMHGRRYSGGLHQAIEAKEGVKVCEESKTFAQISIQNYFRLYEKISGMTGTAETSSEEFRKVYGLDVVVIPTNKPKSRKDFKDLIYKTKEEKYKAITKEIKERSEKGQPILIGTTSIDENEIISGYLSNDGIKHEVLNAKNHEREGEIIAQAGKKSSVTLATNMAGRGVDIVLGGNPQDPIMAGDIKNMGGLFVLGTQRNEARRIDNQLRGRSGRQGDPGETRFFLSLEDDLLRIFGGDRIKSLMTTLNIPEETPIESSFVSRIVNEAQKKVEGLNFDARKHLLEYDDVINKQRKTVYKRRQNILEKIENGEVREVIENLTENTLTQIVSQISDDESLENAKEWMGKAGISKDKEESENIIEEIKTSGKSEILSRKIEDISSNSSLGLKIIGSLDMFWTNHLENLEALMESVRMRAYGQKDPLVEYKREGYDLFKNLIFNAEMWVVSNIFKKQEKVETPVAQVISSNKGPEIGRNDPCYCGSGKKYKKCHGK